MLQWLGPSTRWWANGRLIDFQAGIGFARALGGGLVASVDGLRFGGTGTTWRTDPGRPRAGRTRGCLPAGKLATFEADY